MIAGIIGLCHLGAGMAANWRGDIQRFIIEKTSQRGIIHGPPP
jgi:hypothetical protein